MKIFNTRYAGTIAGTNSSSNGYVNVHIAGNNYLLHRIVWLWHNHDVPEYIDHIDRNTKNNSIENLRPCTLAENQQNVKVRFDNKTGYKGIRLTPHGTYVCQVRLQGIRHYIGTFKNLDEAITETIRYRKMLGIED